MPSRNGPLIQLKVSKSHIDKYTRISRGLVEVAMLKILSSRMGAFLSGGFFEEGKFKHS